MQRDTFVFYKDWMEAIKNLPDDIRLEIYESIIEYATSGNIKGLKPMANIAFNFIKTTIDRDVQSYVDKCAKNRENGRRGADYGKLGGRPRNPEKPPITPDGVLETPKNPEKPIDSDSDHDSDIIPPLIPPEGEVVRKFIKPIIQEISDYCTSRRNGIDAEEFYDFYESKGWMIGKNKMKDWKASVRTWEKGLKHQTPKEQKNRYADE